MNKLKYLNFYILTTILFLSLSAQNSFAQCPTGTGTINGSNSVCNLSTSLTYTVTGFSGSITSYNWSVPSGVVITSGTSTNIITVSISGSGVSGTIKAFAINSTPCTLPSVAFNLTVNSLPTVSITGISNLCTGQTSLSIPFSNAINSPNQYYVDWNSAANSAGFIDDSGWLSLTGSNMTINGIISTVPAGNYNASIYVRNSTTGCQTDAANPSFCGIANENTTLSMTSPSGRPFTSVNFASFGTPNGSCGSFTTSTCHAPISYSTIQSAAVGQSTFSIAATNGNFGGDPCSGTAKRLYVELVYPAFYLTMTPAVASITTSATTICSGFNTTLTASAGLSYSWSPGGATSQSIVVSPASTQNYVVTITSSNPTCSTTGVNQTITVNQLPNLTSLTSAALVCYGTNTLVLTYSSATNSPNQYSITWNAAAHTAGLTDVGLTSFSSSPIIVPINTVTSGNYGASILVKNSTTGCQNTLYGLGTVCGTTLENTTLVMTAPGSSLFTAINFASFGTPNGTCGSFITSTCHAPISSSYVQGLALGTNSFSVGATNANFGGDPCSGTAKRLYIQAEYSGFTLTVNPTLSLSSSQTSASCTGTTFNYTPTSSTSGASFAWTRALVPGITNSSSSGTGIISEILINTTTSPIVVNYLYTVSFNGCNSNIQNVTVTSNPTPGTISGISGSSTLCNYQTGVTYSVTSVAGATSYAWTVPSGMVITSGSTTNSITASVSGIFQGGNIISSARNTCGTVTSASFAVAGNAFTSSLYNSLLVSYSFDNSGTDNSGNSNNLILQGSPTYTTDRNGNANSAINFNGSTQYGASTALISTAPSNYSFALWFKSTSTQGGKLIGYGNNQTGNSSSYDRHLYMINSGQIMFGNYSLSAPNILTAATPLSYNDGNWHHVAGTYSTATGISIYIDGKMTITAATNGTYSYAGYWRIGGDNLGSWTSAPTSNYLNGAIDEVYIYNRELSYNEVQLLYGITDNSPVCSSSNLIMNVATFAGASYAWTGPSSFTASAVSATILGVSTVNSGIYTNIISVAGCSISSSKTITIDASVVNSITGAQNICVGQIPLDPLSGTVTPANPLYTYSWELSTITGGSSGYTAATGVNTGTGYTFTTAINTNTYVRRSIFLNNCIYYSNILLMTATSPNLSAPNYYPTNAWYSYVYNAQSWPTANYAGLWTLAGSNTNVDTRTTVTGYGSWTNRPSQAINYSGCQVNNINYSLDVKRTGFNGGIYQIDMLAYDDATYLLINGTQFWSDPNWYNGISKYGVYVGPLTSTTSLQLRLNQGGGGGGFAFNVFPTVPGTLIGGTIGSSQSVCAGNAPDPFTNISLPGSGCSVASYTWQYSNTDTVTGWNDIASSNSATYTYPLSIGQTTYFRRKVTDICSTIAYSNIITVDNNYVPLVAPTVAGVNGWNAYMYYDQYFGSYAGYFTMTGINTTNLGLNTANYFGTGGVAPSTYSQYNGCNISAYNISGKFIRTNFPSAIYQLDINNHDDDIYVFVNGVQAFVHNGCCDAHISAYKGLLGPTDVVEIRWQQGTGGSVVQISLTTTTSTPIVAGTLTPTTVFACAGDIPPQSITTASVTSGCTIIAYQWQQSTVSGTTGFNNISGATTSTLTSNFLINGTTYIRRIDTDACGQSATLSGVVFTVSGVSPGDTSVYGNNIWNSYGYNCYTGNSGALVATAANYTNYRGYATIAGVSFITTTLYTSGTQSPSNIPGYQGCSLLPSQHSTRTKRKGFPAGQYNILLSYDDPGAVLINNVLVYSAACCAGNANTGWSGNLGTNDIIEIRQSQNNGGSYYGITLNPTTVTGLSGVGSIGSDQVVCYSATGITINSIAPATSGGCFITYQFQSSTTPGFTASIVTLSGFTTNVSITGLGPFTQTTYIRRMTFDACGSGAASNIVTISVPGLVSPGSINSVTGVCSGTAPTTITGATLPSGGIGTYTYLWQSSPDNTTWTSIASATGVNYPQPNAISVPTYFRRSVNSGSCVTTATSSILVSLNAVTTITSQPSNTTVCSGSIALFSAVTGGTSTSNQWQISTSGGVYFNLANNQIISTATISGVTAGALSVSGANTSLSGFLFRLLVNGNCGSNITSTGVNINIGGPSVTTQPSNRNICLGNSAVFSFVTSGVATNYLWSESKDNGVTYNVIANNATYSGVSSSILTVNGLSTSMTGYRYLCNVTTSCNTFATSTVAGILTVSGLIANNTITGTSPICGSTATTITGTTATGGGGVYSYLWQSSPDGSTWTNITTATSINYSTPPLTTTTFYRRTITSGSGCTDNNNSIQISITQTASIVTQPSALSVCLNGTGILSTTATGAGLTYSWVESISGWTPVNTTTGIYSGSNTASLTITGAPLSISGRQFRCIVSGTCNVTTTNGVSVTINTPPTIVTNPTGYITCANSTSPIFTASATGTTISYQWQVSTDNGFSYSYVPGIAPYTWTPDTRLTNTLAIGGGPVPASYNGYVYRVEVSGTCAPKAYSIGAILTVNSAISGNSISPSQSLCQGTPSSLTGTVAPTLLGGDGSYVYKWQNSPDNSTWADINPTVTSSNFAPPFLSTTTYYRRLVSSFDCPLSTSNTATIAITPGTTVTSSPVNASVCENTNASFTVAASGNSLGYQWQYASSSVAGGNWQDLTPVVSGVVINGTTSTTMTVVNAPPSFNGYLFRAIVNGNCAPLQATSTGVSLTTNPAPMILQNPSNAAACINGNIQLNTSATGTGIIVYNWKESTGTGFNLLADGGVYSNSSTTSINLSNIPLSYSGRQYIALAAIGGCTISSTGANITINQPTSITSSLTRTMCSASFLNYSITASVFGSTISWNRPSVSGISNAAGSGSTASIVEMLSNTTSLPVNVFYNLNPVGPMPTTCSGTGAVLTVTVYPGAAGNWIGSLNSDWFNTGNWCGGTVPASSISASIFSGTLFYPAITTSGANVLDLSIGSSSFLSVTGSNTLGIYGNFSNNGTFVFSNSSTVNFLSASLTQTISGASINTFANLAVSNTSSGGVILGNTSKILGTLTLSSNTKLVTTGHPLVLLSNSITGTARIASIPSNSTIVGNITVQRYIPAKLTYRFLASPVSGATISNWQGTMFITGNGSGSDLGSSVPVVATYTESLPGDQNTGFQSLTSGTSTTFQTGLGYRVFVRGDRSIVLTSNYAATPTTLSVTGAPNIGTVTLPVTYTSTSGGTVSTDGWNLVGNPYASQIDWNLITTGGANFQHLDNAMYILDPVSASSTTAGSYLAYVNGVAAGPGAGSPNPNLISSSQSFFVHANAANPVLKLTESVKSSGTANDHFKDEEIPNLLRISIMGESGDDNTVIRFSEDASDLFDSYTDAYKLANSLISISTKPVTGLNLAINTMKVLNNSPKIVPVSISTSRFGDHKFVINNVGTFDPNIKIELVDKYLNTINTVTEGFTYDFNTTSITGSTGDSRFEVVFTPQYGNVKASMLPDSLTSQNPDIKWSINGNWYSNTQIASHLPIGNYTIIFSTITGWYTPASQEITVNTNTTTSLTGIYVLKPKIGSVLVKLTPNSIEKGRIKTQWRINKGVWQSSNTQLDSLPIGNYTISFNDLSGYIKPHEVDIFISEGNITILTSAYFVADTADQTVVLNPSDLPTETILGINTSSITSNIINFDSSSVKSFIISASPNPVGDNLLTIKLKAKNSEKVLLEVYNQAGKLIYSNFIELSTTSIITETKLDILRDFPIGIYLFKFVQNERVILKKIAK